MERLRFREPCVVPGSRELPAARGERPRPVRQYRAGFADPVFTARLEKKLEQRRSRNGRASTRLKPEPPSSSVRLTGTTLALYRASLGGNEGNSEATRR